MGGQRGRHPPDTLPLLDRRDFGGLLFPDPQHHRRSARKADDGSGKGGFHTKAGVIAQTAPCGYRSKQRGVCRKAAVGQPENQVLGEIPHGMVCHGEPQAVQILDGQCVKQPDRGNIDQGQHSHTVVADVEDGEKEAAKNQCQRDAVPLPDVIKQIPPNQQLLGGGLDEHHEERNHQPQRGYAPHAQANIPVEKRHQNTRSVHAKTGEKAQASHFQVVAPGAAKIEMKNILSGDPGVNQDQRADANKGEIGSDDPDPIVPHMEQANGKIGQDGSRQGPENEQKRPHKENHQNIAGQPFFL